MGYDMRKRPTWPGATGSVLITNVPGTGGVVQVSDATLPDGSASSKPCEALSMTELGAEDQRLQADAQRQANWKRWGPYLSERQWGTVREDYSPQGTVWDYFRTNMRAVGPTLGRRRLARPYRSRMPALLRFGIVEWQGQDSQGAASWLERPGGNHGEDVKECYFYLDGTPTHSYMRALYKYPQSEFPYARLLEENRRRARSDPEFELIDTGIFNDHRYFDVQVEYAKADPDDVLIRIGDNEPRPGNGSACICYRHSGIGTPGSGAANTMAAGCDRISDARPLEAARQSHSFRKAFPGCRPRSPRASTAIPCSPK